MEHYPNKFYFYYAVSLALTIVNNVWCVLVYRFRTADQVLGPEPVEQVKNESGEYEALAEQTSGEKMKRIMKLPRTWFIACHLLAYVGLEVTIGMFPVRESKSTKTLEADIRLVSGSPGGWIVSRERCDIHRYRCSDNVLLF